MKDKVSPLAARVLGRICKMERPTFIQGYKRPYDRIVPIHVGEFLPELEPTVYYSAKQDDERFYLLYCVFHWKDWSDSPGWIGKLDTHQFDFEGALRIIHKNNGPEWVITVFHTQLRFYRTIQNVINIEPEGHGMSMKAEFPYPTCRVYKDYKLEDIHEPKRFLWFKTDLREIFNRSGVNMPWQWNHWKIRRKYGKKTDGLIYRDPLELLRLAKRCRIIGTDKPVKLVGK